MFFEFAYKGDSVRASFDGLGKVVEPSRGKRLEGYGKIVCASGKIFPIPVLMRNI